MANEYEYIYKWLKDKDYKTLVKYWQVVSRIEDKRALSDEHSLLYHTIDFQGINHHDLVDILINLHKKDFIFVGMKLGETPKNDKGLPMASVWEDITDKPDEVLSSYSSRTEIQLQHGFKRLVSALKDLVSNESEPVSTQSSDATPGMLLPKPWELVETDKKATLIREGKTLHLFPNTWAQKYKFFKCLCSKHGRYVTYKEVYEFESNLKYPDKQVTNTNRNIRSTINKLRKDFKKLPIDIETSKGFTLTLQ